MITITQLIYVKEGAESVFNQFEAMAMPLISKYRGSLLLRLRPKPDDLIEGVIDLPYEIHLVEFPAEQDFQFFMKDEERKKFLPLKEQSVKSVILFKGQKIN